MTAADPLQGGSISVLEGQDGWLFLKTFDNIDVIRLYTEDYAIEASVYRRWAAVLARRRAHFAREGIGYVTLIVPDAHLVYRDKLPDDIRLCELSPFARLAALLDDSDRQQVVYPLTELIDNRPVQETYQAVDSHWSDWGSWLGYLATMRAVAAQCPRVRVLELDDIDWWWRATFGALGSVMTPERSVTVQSARVKNPSARVVRQITTEVREGYTVMEQDAPDLPVAVIFRDSFMTAPAKFFAESFRRTVFVSSPNTVYYDLIEQERPDVVIHEVGERRLLHAPVEPNATEFRATFGDLLLDDPRAVADQRRSRSLSRAGRADEALTASDDVIARVAPNARIMVHRARLHLSLDRPDAALEALRHATTLDPSDGTIWFFLGQALAQKERVADAMVAFEHAIELEPHQMTFWPVAVATALREDPAHALELVKRGSLLHPESPVLASAEGSALVALGRLDEAETAIRRAVVAQPATAWYARQLASVLIRRESWQAAHDVLAEIVRAAPDDADVAKYLALVQQRLGTTASPAVDAEGET